VFLLAFSEFLGTLLTKEGHQRLGSRTVVGDPHVQWVHIDRSKVRNTNGEFSTATFFTLTPISMKHSILIAMVLLSCSPAVDLEKEKAAILAVLQEEGDASAAADMNRIAAIHTGTPQDVRLAWNGAGVEQYDGWDNIEALYKEYTKNGAADASTKNSKENAVVKISNGTAWVVCDNVWKWTADGKDGRSSNAQVIFLEKQDGKWKVAFNAFLPRTDPKSIDGVYEYLAPGKGMAVNRNGKFIYIYGGSNAKAPMTSNSGTYEFVGDSIKNTITYPSDPRQAGTVFWWKVKSWSGDTLNFVTMDERGRVTGNVKAVRVGL
jgi:ketosteroid isomerase-like protein